MGTFYRAYEWSAWLICNITYNDNVRLQSKDRKPLSVKKKKMKDNNDSFIFVGFPVHSVDKFIPTRIEFTSDENEHLVITIEIPKDDKPITYERLEEGFKKWAESIPLDKKPDNIDAEGNTIPPEPKTPKPNNKAPVSIQQPRGGLISQILAYRLEMHTDMENRQFIAELQQQIINFL